MSLVNFEAESLTSALHYLFPFLIAVRSYHGFFHLSLLEFLEINKEILAQRFIRQFNT